MCLPGNEDNWVGGLYCFVLVFFTHTRKKKKKKFKNKEWIHTNAFFFFPKIYIAAYEGTVLILNQVPNKDMPKFKNMHFPFLLLLN